MMMEVSSVQIHQLVADYHVRGNIVFSQFYARFHVRI